MIEIEDWQRANEEHLAAALKWLRLRLTQMAGSMDSAAGSESPASSHELFAGKKAEARHELPPPAKIPTDTEVEEARGIAVRAEKQEPLPAITFLSHRLGLSHFEREVLLLCTAMELDTRIPALCARAQNHPSRPYPTFALAMAMFEHPAWDVLSPEQPLRYWRLIEINQPAAQPLTASALRADERIVNLIKGLNYLDDRLAPLVAPVEQIDTEHELPLSQQSVVEAVTDHIQYVTSVRLAPIVQLLGVDGPRKALVARHVADRLGIRLYRLPANTLPTQVTELESAKRFITRSHGVCFLDTREAQPGLGHNAVALEVGRPTPAEQQTVWSDVLGSRADDSPALLAGQFDLDLNAIQEIGQAVLARSSDDCPIPPAQLWDACLSRKRPRLDALAQRIDAKAVWEDIVLPDQDVSLLAQIAAQVRQRTTVYDQWGFGHKMNRGLGISALFAGESGTGKTMAAEVIANDLRLNLYRIDLSAVVSKYIGETEKNLRRLFDAAEGGGAILFFDEADALFGKRSEVKDSHDRYANIESNYLLQRMEGYRGLAILATNMKSALDTAFLRRLRFIVNFPFPGVKERKLIWESVFPKADESRGLTGTPVGRLNYDQLAKLNLTGGSIHNIALNAAFLAAQAGSKVTMPFVLEAARTEFRKLERPINEADFRILEAVGTKV